MAVSNGPISNISQIFQLRLFETATQYGVPRCTRVASSCRPYLSDVFENCKIYILFFDYFIFNIKILFLIPDKYDFYDMSLPMLLIARLLNLLSEPLHKAVVLFWRRQCKAMDSILEMALQGCVVYS